MRFAGAVEVIEPARDEIRRSRKSSALAVEKPRAEASATAITVDCNGTMYRQLPAFPCGGLTRQNDRGLAGICEAALGTALTFRLFQSLTGKPGFINDPTGDESADRIVLAHCLGATRMGAPDGAARPYKLRSIMERQGGAVMQVKMRKGEHAIQGELVGLNKVAYFTAAIIDAPHTDRGCRTKVSVRVDGDVRALWRNWNAGPHRVTCYGDITDDLKQFRRFKSVQLTDEVAAAV